MPTDEEYDQFTKAVEDFRKKVGDIPIPKLWRTTVPHYILTRDYQIKKVRFEEWMIWNRFDAKKQLSRVDWTEIGHFKVSTVFLGINHGFDPPILFETMIFGGAEDGEYQTRCATYEEALEMHREGVRVAEARLKT